MGKKAHLKKEERKNLKGWAEGGHKQILSKHVLTYSDCLELGWRAEETCFDMVCREYIFHIGWHLKDHEEPAQPFRFYNPHAPREVEELTPEEAKEKQERLEEIFWVSEKCQRSFHANITFYLAYKMLAEILCSETPEETAKDVKKYAQQPMEPIPRSARWYHKTSKGKTSLPGVVYG